jgi:thiamine-phosphate pyrophosphorylase
LKPRIVLVTDPAYGDKAVVQVILAAAEVLPIGVLAVQLRDTTRTPDVRRAFAFRLRDVTRAVRLPLLVNGDLELARDVCADGLHLGFAATQKTSVADARRVLGRDTFVSLAAHSDKDVIVAREARADAVLVSPIFAVRDKGPPRGVDAIARARAIAAQDMLVYALGGVGPAEAPACLDAGADGIAVIRALLAAEDPRGVALSLRQIFSARSLG